MQMSISEASKRFVVSQNIIYYYALDGMITIHTDEHGKKWVEVADLHRLYDPRPEETSSVAQPGQSSALEYESPNAFLQARVELLELRIQHKDEQIRALRKDRTGLWTRVKNETNQVKLLANKTTQPNRPWWKKLWKSDPITPWARSPW